MLLGFASYGLSILVYVMAQRGLGAARTSAYYAVGPFIGVAMAWVLFGDAPGAGFLAALALMTLGVGLADTFLAFAKADVVVRERMAAMTFLEWLFGAKLRMGCIWARMRLMAVSIADPFNGAMETFCMLGAR
jgi:hypothetical protein